MWKVPVGKQRFEKVDLRQLVNENWLSNEYHWQTYREGGCKYMGPEAVYYEIMVRNDYENYNIPDLKEGFRVKDGDVVVDVGANIGCFSHKVLSQYHIAKLVSLEPCVDNFECLEHNVESIEGAKDKSLLLRAALHSGMGAADFQSNPLAGGGSLVEYLPEEARGESFKVPVLTLDSLFDSKIVEYIDFLKMDVEGAEIDIFKGIRDENLLKIDRISMEYHHSVNNDTDRHTLYSRLAGLGFKLWIVNTNSALEDNVYFWRP